VLRRINDRIWRPGEFIPNEAELAEEFGCARATVNRALRELADAGYLDRRRKAGTRVALHPVRKATLDIPIIRLDVEQRGAAYGYSLIELVRTSPPVRIRSRLRLQDGVEMLHIRALHLANGHPYAYEDRWVNPTAVPDILSADLSAISANEWLVRNATFTRGDIAFSATNAGPVEAEMLSVPEGAALFVVERTTWMRGVPITSVLIAYAPGHRMHTTL